MDMSISLKLCLGDQVFTSHLTPEEANALMARIDSTVRNANADASALATWGRDEDSAVGPLPSLYVVNRWGVAVPCVDELDATAQTTRRDQMYPFNAPHVVRRMVDAS